MKFLLTLMLTVSSLAAFSVANFTSDKTAGCPPLVVNFTDQSTDTPAHWTWNFNDGNTSNFQNPQAIFTNPGIYKVKLVESNANGTQTDSVIKIITVFQLPVVNFTATSPNICLHDTLSLQSNIISTDAPITQYAWGFGNGIASSDSVAHYLYSQIGSYNITLVVQDSNGCAGNISKPGYVHVYGLPVAAFTASPTSSCSSQQLVTFTNHSTGGGLTYFWQLDSASTSTNANPTYLYQQEQTTAVLTVTDSNGCTSSASQGITIATLTAGFTVSKTVLCTGSKATFTNTSTIPGTSWYWSFGDGTTATTSGATKSYTTPGVYTVKFVVRDATCADSITKVNYITVVQGFSVNQTTFTADSTITCGTPLTTTFTNTTPVGGGCTYSWDFGDGDTSSQPNPTTTYTAPGTYTVTLTIADSNGCIITGSKTDYIQTAPPVAKFAVDSSICFGASLGFANRSTNAQVYMWLFGDGDTSFATNPVHTYAAEGYYTVALYAYNKAGCDTSITVANCVHITPVHVDFHVSSTFSPCPPFVTLFSSQSDPQVNKFKWIFGDGYTDTAKNPTHIYFFPGVYTVKLVGTTAQGCIDTMTYANLITVQGPTGQFTIAPATGCIPLQVTITASPSASTSSIWCDLGDGTVVQDTTNISHTYTQARVFHPEFVLTDHQGCSVSYPLDSVITHPIPKLAVSDTSVCSGVPVTISIASNVSQIQWAPSTLLNCSTCSTVSLTPVDSMAYQVTATNQYGCQTVAQVHVNAVPLPVLNDSVSARLCAEDSKTLFVGNASKVTWSPGLYLSDSAIANPVCTPLASVNYSVTAFNVLGCSVNTQVPVKVENKVAISLTSEANVCTDGSVNLPVSIVFASDLGATYIWNKPEYLNDVTSSDPLASPGTHSMDFMVIVSSGHCIPDTQTVAVKVIETPDLEVTSALTTTPGADVPLYAASHQQLTYHWYADDSLSCEDCRRTNVYPTKTQTVYVVGTNSTGCSIKDSVHITIEGCDAGTVFLPNTFTPNGDGLNDVFYVRSKALSGLKYFRIFDRWGNQVFETDNLNEGWDGTYNGKPAPQGTYVYMLEGQCQNGYDVKKSGDITAIR